MIIKHGKEMFSHQIDNRNGKEKSADINGTPPMCVRHCARCIKNHLTHMKITPLIIFFHWHERTLFYSNYT